VSQSLGSAFDAEAAATPVQGGEEVKEASSNAAEEDDDAFGSSDTGGGLDFDDVDSQMRNEDQLGQPRSDITPADAASNNGDMVASARDGKMSRLVDLVEEDGMKATPVQGGERRAESSGVEGASSSAAEEDGEAFDASDNGGDLEIDDVDSPM